jgi:hypothetical protein
MEASHYIESTPVVSVTEGGFTTQNSVYRIEILCEATVIDRE